MSTSRTLRTGLYAGISALAIFASTAPAHAQDSTGQPAPDEQTDDTASGEDTGREIIVTGSRIPRAGFDTIQPALVTSAEQIDARGYTNVGQAL